MFECKFSNDNIICSYGANLCIIFILRNIKTGKTICTHNSAIYGNTLTNKFEIYMSATEDNYDLYIVSGGFDYENLLQNINGLKDLLGERLKIVYLNFGDGTTKLAVNPIDGSYSIIFPIDKKLIDTSKMYIFKKYKKHY